MIRGTFRPFPGGNLEAKGLRITGFYIGDHYVPGGPRTRAVGNVTYEHKHFNAGFDYLSAARPDADPRTSRSTPKGWSVWGTPFFKEKGNGPEMLLRYDHYQPDSSARSESHARHRRVRLLVPASRTAARRPR